MPRGISPIAPLEKMIHGVDQHQDDKHLACTVMKLPEEPTVGNECCDIFYILKHVSRGAIVKGQNKPRNNA